MDYQTFVKLFSKTFGKLALEKYKNFKYSVGQPMGIYSSWASMSISHHMLVQLAYYETLLKCTSVLGYSRILDKLYQKFQKYGFSNYSILGDDIVIFDELVALSYLELLSKLGIGISIEKCFISFKVCEFAKRFITVKNVINPFSASILSNVIDNTDKKRSASVKHRSFGELSLILESWKYHGYKFDTLYLIYAIFVDNYNYKGKYRFRFGRRVSN